MGNCISSIKGRQQPRKSVTLALVGVDNAGKTTASSSFAGEDIDRDVAPTIGFRNVKFSFEKYDINLYDIGGGKNIRPVWKNYFAEVYGFIYVVDSSTADRMEEARETFRECLEHPSVSGKPVLLLANKQDKPECLDEVDICEHLNLESVVNTNKCPCHIAVCSALHGTGKKMDSHMKQGLKWLLSMVEGSWQELKSRVEQDMKAADQVRKVEAAARRERVRKQREERERKEEEKRQKLGITKKESDEEDIVDGDPFKPLDIKQLQQKEDALKAEKKRIKRLEAELREKEANQGALFTKVPQPFQHAGDQDTSAGRTEVGERVFSPRDKLVEGGERLFSPREDGDRHFPSRTLPKILPPLQPLGTPFLEDSGQTKKKKKKKTPRSSEGEKTQKSKDRAIDDDDDIVLATPRSQPVLNNSYLENSVSTVSNIMVSTHDDFPSREMLAAGISRVPCSLDGGDDGLDADTPRARKVKKKKLRQLGTKHNGQAGSDLEMTPRPKSSAEESSGTGTGKNKYVWRSGFGPTEEETSDLSARSQQGKTSNGLVPLGTGTKKSSRHSQMHSNVSLESDPQGSRVWGLAEDLPTVAGDTIVYRKPNALDSNPVI